ncbi:MAG TPA: hypothetical protein VEF06_14720 [Bryobacteraceae bacterium]|nr:hypothetical protein [Bryobacteraceae bacterium]
MKRNLYVGAAILALAAGFGIGSAVLGRKAKVEAAGMTAPHFEVDPLWPKPLPNHWIIGQTIGLDVDKNDNVWIIHRPGTFDSSGKETYAMNTEGGHPWGDCCVAAPDVLEFNAAGDLIGHFARTDMQHDWPSSNHGITVDPTDGTIWLGGNGAGQNAPRPGAAAAPGAGRAAAPARGGRGANPGAEEGVATGQGAYHDSFILHFTADGKWLGEIGGANMNKGSNDPNAPRGVAEIRFNKEGEMIAADGYGNKRVSIWDPKTLKIKRFWGAYGTKEIDDKNPGAYIPPTGDPAANADKQFRNPVHCAVPSNDGLIYVCDRVNDRLQVFKEDGTYVKEIYMEIYTRGDGSVWEIAFSKDPAQKYMYIADGSNERIHVFERESLKEIYAFGDGGRQPGQFYAVHSIATNSKGDIFTTETYRGQRVQKFLYKGIKPVEKDYTGTSWPKK